jgi:hypothetical protein
MKTSLLILLSILLLTTACDNNDGPAEKAGAALDSVVDKAKQAVEDLDGDGPYGRCR